MLTPRIFGVLNNGYIVAAELEASQPGTRCFVSIQPIANPDIPREEYRYLNSKYSIWEYWHFVFHRMVLRSGWEGHDSDYDFWLVEENRVKTITEIAFYEALARWIPDARALLPYWESECPDW